MVVKALSMLVPVATMPMELMSTMKQTMMMRTRRTMSIDYCYDDDAFDDDATMTEADFDSYCCDATKDDSEEVDSHRVYVCCRNCYC